MSVSGCVYGCCKEWFDSRCPVHGLGYSIKEAFAGFTEHSGRLAGRVDGCVTGTAFVVDEDGEYSINVKLPPGASVAPILARDVTLVFGADRAAL